MIEGIHHIGLAVRSIDTVGAFMKEMFGAELMEDQRLETPEFISQMVRVGEDVFELLEPRGENGLIERFLNSRGEGIHHYSLRVDNPVELLDRCEEKGMTLLGRRFIHPKSAHGMLIEIIGADERL